MVYIFSIHNIKCIRLKQKYHYTVNSQHWGGDWWSQSMILKPENSFVHVRNKSNCELRLLEKKTWPQCDIAKTDP